MIWINESSVIAETIHSWVLFSNVLKTHPWPIPFLLLVQKTGPLISSIVRIADGCESFMIHKRDSLGVWYSFKSLGSFNRLTWIDGFIDGRYLWHSFKDVTNSFESLGSFISGWTNETTRVIEVGECSHWADLDDWFIQSAAELRAISCEPEGMNGENTFRTKVAAKR